MAITRRNLISKRTGLSDHMIADTVTDILFPKSERYVDTVKSDTNEDEIRKRECIKNQYVSIDWIKKLIETKEWHYIGKNKALYEYFVDDDSIMKPNLVNDEDEESLYKRASGDMQFDFDDLEDCIIEDIKRAFLEVSKKSSVYHWFEYSWSHSKKHVLSGCHVRIYVKLNIKSRNEWGFYYIHYLNALLKKVNDEYREKVIDHIDWSCCSVTRGFAIPYNEGGVFMGYTYNEDNIKACHDEDELDKAFKQFNSTWYDELFDYFVKKFINPSKKKELEKMGLLKETGEWHYLYSMDEDWDMDENHQLVSGEDYNYNWRLSLVTTLMGVFNNDKEIVRNICSVIYKYIRPYKQHTYDEMMNIELEKKIFPRADFELEPSAEMLKELAENWGLKITRRPRIQ